MHNKPLNRQNAIVEQLIATMLISDYPLHQWWSRLDCANWPMSCRTSARLSWSPSKLSRGAD